VVVEMVGGTNTASDSQVMSKELATMWKGW
jgi:hypothetical protein